ncbi:MAG TPA: M48 family metalloprotease, partial [Myxococcota bacterium]|nr:M48 family metalloprotease [Myxococcota bacterium]
EIGTRLARYAPPRDFDYRFRIVDQEAPNAFALPGGQIYVSRGLLLLANSEDELANVIGHEIVHAALRHASARQSVIESFPIFQILAVGAIASYSREQEREADRVGQQLAARAGYDPEAMARFLKQLDYTERLHFGSSRLPGFFDTHPTTRDRVAEATARARSIPWQSVEAIAPGREGYLARIDGLAVGTRAAEGVFQKDRFLHAELDVFMRFPEGWETRNSRAAVGAISPKRDAQVVLELQGPGEDPEAAVEEFMASDEAIGLGLDGPPQPVRLGQIEAVRATGAARTPAGPLKVHLTWIAWDGNIYRLTGIAVSGLSERYEGIFRSVARSFRPLTDRERESIQEMRLRVAQARPGESLGALSERTRNRWDLQQTAVMNAVFADAPLADAQLVKVAVLERYAAERAPPPAPPATPHPASSPPTTPR